MKDWSFLLQPGKAGEVTFTDLPPGVLWDELLALRPRNLQFRLLRGSRMETPADLGAEFAAALQFPPYASATFDSLDECLNDLGWLAEGPLTLVVVGADRVLVRADRKAHDAFLQILGRAMQAWAGGENGPPRALHTIFQSTQARRL